MLGIPVARLLERGKSEKQVVVVSPEAGENNGKLLFSL